MKRAFNMIKNVIFDMGGVLIDYDPEKTLYSIFDRETADAALREIFRNKLWSAKDRGDVFPEDIMRIAGDKIPADSYDKIKEMVFNYYPYMPPFENMYPLVLSLKRNGYGVYLLSNASGDFYERKSGIPALALFDGYLISADYHLLKPEPEIYEKLFTKFGLNREECVFIDDSPENVRGSENAGMKAVCHKGGAEGLAEKLRAAGVKI